jgi:uncharacterized protein YecT (DUF1311 family)
VQIKSVIVVVAFVATGLAGGAFAQSQASMTPAACNKLKNADAALNRVYQEILKAKADDPNFVKAFRDAQSAWLAFRDAHVRTIFPDPDLNAYGTAYSMCHCTVVEKMTTLRTRELQHLWVQGIDEGDVCTGSCVVKPVNAGPNRKK